MEVDHIIIFSANEGKEAEELTSFGLKEGSNRIHVGQGTRNRKFYFDGFFLELVWAYNKKEIASALTAPTGLWNRANPKNKRYSPFGLCLANSHELDILFKECVTYRPSYVPERTSFEIITNEEHPYLPWTCHLPFEPNKAKPIEPTHHHVDIKKLTKIKFGICQEKFRNSFTDFLTDRLGIVFESAKRHLLTLEFDHALRGQIKKFKELPLILEY